ncbi:hypothetical protein A7Q10_08830 [Methylacidiphilum caldifontis]|uniref:Uncharacterized protein n=1 Tax=Methylacidiphilum caldifontis TaxID=2795386 RepID=A0A4Y8PBE5_9BACT|nr:hypothetical protein A7Q10_08830 [Methylacidiphilum caldifontis]
MSLFKNFYILQKELHFKINKGSKPSCPLSTCNLEEEETNSFLFFKRSFLATRSIFFKGIFFFLQSLFLFFHK